MHSAHFFMETLSFKELGRLLTIVASSASVAWAGQLAQTNSGPEAIQSENAIAAFRATARVLMQPEVQTETKKSVSSLAEFAKSEIQQMTELSQTLTERAELLPAGLHPSDDKILKSIEGLDESLILARHALAKYKASSLETRAFAEENMKSQLFRLQESAREAQGLFIARENAQSFNVSKTGQ